MYHKKGMQIGTLVMYIHHLEEFVKLTESFKPLILVLKLENFGVQENICKIVIS